jgi:hypothetical protein
MKKIFALLLLVVAGTANALTQAQSQGMVSAKCAGTYFASLVISDRQGLDREDELRGRVVFASGIAQNLIGNVKTERLAYGKSEELIKAYEKNSSLGQEKIARDMRECDKIMKGFQ